MIILELKCGTRPEVKLEMDADEIRQLKNALFELRSGKPASGDYSETEAQICSIFDLLSYGKLQKDTIQKYTKIQKGENE